MKQAFQIILANLPRHAEEGNHSQIISIEQLQNLVGQACNQEMTLAVIKITEQLLLSCSLLDKNHLTKNEWRFVSFPAFLFGQSILQTWVDQDHLWFPESFWYPEQPISILDKQRQTLHELETRRIQLNGSVSNPIRFVHVAWAFIKLDGCFLVFHREDKHRLDVPNFVPIGGKLHLFDFESVTDVDQCLNRIQQPSNVFTQKALFKTIAREIEEEIGLEPLTDYQCDELIDLKPYRQVEGAGAKHAYTEYDFKCFSVSLSQSGFFKIHETMLLNRLLTLFNANEMTEGVSAKGETLYLEALYKHFSDNKEQIHNWFANIPESYPDSYRYTDRDLAFDFPYDSNEPFLFGKTGKEQKITHDLDANEVSWLLALAWHGKQLEFDLINDDISLLPHGWCVLNHPDSVHCIQSLAKKLANAGYELIEWSGENKFRLSIDPYAIHFSPTLFEINISENEKGDEYTFNVACSSITLPIGKTLKSQASVKITELVFKSLSSIISGNEINIYENESLQKQMRRIEIQFKKMGLRKVLRITNGVYKINQA